MKSRLILSIIIVGTNEKKFVFKCLDSIFKSNFEHELDVIVIDNASNDGTSEMLKEHLAHVKMISNAKKMSYMYNNNLGIKSAQGEYILILNSDIELQSDTLQLLVDFMESHPEAAASACKLTFEDGTLQLTCRRFPSPLTYFCRIPHFFRWIKINKKFLSNRIISKYLMLDYDHQKTKEVDWILSALMLMRKSAVNDIGLLDEKLMPPFYLEDMDWCYRAHLKGWQIYYVPETSAKHYYRRDSVKRFGKLSFVHLFNVLIFFRKHGIQLIFNQHCQPQKVSIRP